MTIETFMKDEFETLKAIISRELPNQKFDSHDFIRCFAKNYELEYVKFLGAYKSKPFWQVHMQIANFLSKRADALNLKKNGKVISQNVFGNEVENEEWMKIN